MSSNRTSKIQRYFEIDTEAAVEELYAAADEEPLAPPDILASIGRLSGWQDPPDVVLISPKSAKWTWEDGGMFLGNPDGTGAIILEPGTYDYSEIPITGLVFRGTTEASRESHEWNNRFRIAFGWFTRANH